MTRVETDEAIKRYAPDIKKLANKFYRFNQKTGVCVEDIYQEGLLGFLSAFKNFDSLEELSENYCIRSSTLAMRNYVLDELTNGRRRTFDRKGGKIQNLSEQIGTVALDDSVLETGDFCHEYLNIEVQEFIDWCGKRNWRHPTIIQLLLSGYSETEIADRCNVSAPTIKRALRDIRKLYNDYSNKEVPENGHGEIDNTENTRPRGKSLRRVSNRRRKDNT